MGARRRHVWLRLCVENASIRVMPALLVVEGKRYPVEGCLLDKDGTLLRFDHWFQVMALRAQKLAAALCLVPAQRQALLSIMGLDDSGQASGAHGIIALPRNRAEQAVVDYLRRECRLDAQAAGVLVLRTFAEVDDEFPFSEHLRPTPGASSFLHAARHMGVKTAVVTHDGRAAAEQHLGALGWDSIVDAVLGIEDIRCPKPSPEGVFDACRRLGIAPDRALMAGDTWVDVGAGRGAGCRPVVGVLTGLGDVAQLAEADHIVPDLTSLSFCEHGS